MRWSKPCRRPTTTDHTTVTTAAVDVSVMIAPLLISTTLAVDRGLQQPQSDASLAQDHQAPHQREPSKEGAHLGSRGDRRAHRVEVRSQASDNRLAVHSDPKKMAATAKSEKTGWTK